MASVVCQGKNYITRGLGKKFLHKPNHPYPPAPQKSNGRPLSYVIYQMSHRADRGHRGQARSSTEHNNELGYRWVTLYNNDKRPILNHLDRQFKCTRVGLSDVHDIISVEISIHGLKC